MYQIELHRAAYKDLDGLPANYARLIAGHIDVLEQNPRPVDAKKLRGDSGYSCHIAYCTILMTRQK